MKRGSILKKIICELCGSNDFERKNGLYICLYCRTSFTIEEANSWSTEETNDNENDQLIELKNLQKKAFDSGAFTAFISHSEKILSINSNDNLSELGAVMANVRQISIERLSFDFLSDILSNWENAHESQLEVVKAHSMKLYDTFIYKLLVEQSKLFSMDPNQALEELLSNNIDAFYNFPQAIYTKQLIGERDLASLNAKQQRMIKRLGRIMTSDWTQSFVTENTPPMNVSISIAENKIQQANHFREFVKVVIIDKVIDDYERFLLCQLCEEMKQVASTHQMIVEGSRRPVPIFEELTDTDQQINDYLQARNDLFSDLIVHHSWQSDSKEKQDIYTLMENLQDELHTLGIFSGNRKKEVLYQIETLKNRLRNVRVFNH